jgi:hypothetical protein
MKKFEREEKDDLQVGKRFLLSCFTVSDRDESIDERFEIFHAVLGRPSHRSREEAI